MAKTLYQNMNNPAEELDKHFNALKNLKNSDEYFNGITKYIRFIKNTYPLNSIADSIFSSSTTPSTILLFKSSYESGSCLVHPGTPGISMFHSLMIEEARKQGFVKKKAITRDVDGDFYYKEKKLPFRKKTICYYIFDYLFGLANNRASYKNIDAYLSTKGLGSISNEDKRKERIRNAIKVYEKNKRYPASIGSNSVLEVQYGFGVQLNNPDV